MTTPDTSVEAYKEVLEAGDDVSLRRRVAALLADAPRTTHELHEAMGHSENAIRPRVNELLRMGCVERDGKRANPSGHMAYVNHLTPRGHAYLRGEIDPDPEPTVTELQAKVVEAARAHLRGEAGRDILALAVSRHDDMKRRTDPEWHGGLAGGDDDE